MNLKMASPTNNQTRENVRLDTKLFISNDSARTPASSSTFQQMHFFFSIFILAPRSTVPTTRTICLDNPERDTAFMILTILIFDNNVSVSASTPSDPIKYPSIDGPKYYIPTSTQDPQGGEVSPSQVPYIQASITQKCLSLHPGSPIHPSNWKFPLLNCQRYLLTLPKTSGFEFDAWISLYELFSEAWLEMLKRRKYFI